MWGSDGISVSVQRGNDLARADRFQPDMQGDQLCRAKYGLRVLDYLSTMAKTTPSERIGHLVSC